MTDPRPEHEAAARRRLQWAVALRAAIASTLLGAAILLQVDASPLPGGHDGFFVLIGATYALTGLYAATWRRVERHPWLADLQFAGDIVLVSCLVGLTGGVTSFFASLYALPIVSAAVVQQRRGGLGAAALAAVLYAGIVAAQYVDAAPPQPRPEVLPAPGDAAYRVAMNVGGFLLVGLLTSSLAAGRRRADERLAHASLEIADLQAFTRRVVDSLPGGLLTADEAGRVISANRAAETITGLGQAEVSGRLVDEVLQLPSGGLRWLAVQEVRRVEFEYLKPSARRIVLGLSMTTLGGDGGTSGYLFTFQDVTESKRRDFEAHLQKRLAAVGEMAAGIAHEIRNPLASMTGSIQLLRRELPLDPDQAILMDIVLRESERLNQTIRDFLAYARPQRPAHARVQVGRLLAETAALLRNSPDCRPGHRIDAPSTDAGPECVGDEAQLRQVVWNLAVNGLRAMPEGGTLTLRARAERSRVIVEVQDTGRGMGPEQLETLFQPFQSGFAEGLGLGLPIAHRIVTDHGGTIEVASREGEGTVMSVRIPQMAPEQQAAGSSQLMESAA
jgi:two-component system sensor histidine kinase PilS (NtrC family)